MIHSNHVLDNEGSITDVPGISVGHSQDLEALTGCTVILAEEGAICGVDVRGSAPGTRETDLLSPTNAVERVHAIVLSGGSAFGLDAATGVVDVLRERGIGLDVGVAKVPIVPSAILFDLALGRADVYPDREMGREAVFAARSDGVAEGNVGAGTGATVGKLAGPAGVMKGGLGTASIRLSSGLIVGALVAVNAVGEVRNPQSGETLAGPLAPDGSLLSSMALIAGEPFAFGKLTAGTNTTIAVITTNAILTKTQMTKVAQMAHDGMARAIVPVHTMYDGDTVFAMSVPQVAAGVDTVGALAAEVLSRAICRAVMKADRVGSVKAWRDL